MNIKFLREVNLEIVTKLEPKGNVVNSFDLVLNENQVIEVIDVFDNDGKTSSIEFKDGIGFKIPNQYFEVFENYEN